jgi:hypothetical protein
VGEVSARGPTEAAAADGISASASAMVHWDMLADPAGPLGRALDALLGADNWELPCNGQREALDAALPASAARYPPPPRDHPRYVYCPVAMTEHDNVSADDVREAAALVASSSSLLSSLHLPEACSGARPALLCSPFDAPFLQTLDAARRAHLAPGSAAAAAATWQPINRRRYLNKGWHLDVGPGFPNEGARTLRGDPRQGVVMLLLLTDCAPGAGGTALIAGSHDWMLRRLARAGGQTGHASSSQPDCALEVTSPPEAAAAAESAESPLTHEALNTIAVKLMRRLTEAGRVALPCANACRACYADFCDNPPPPAVPSDQSAAMATGIAADAGAANADADEDAVFALPRTIRVDQIVGRAGDVCLMHPLLLHSGTANCAILPRVLANGVARLKPKVAPTSVNGSDDSSGIHNYSGIGNDRASAALSYGDADLFQCPILARDMERLGLRRGV